MSPRDSSHEFDVTEGRRVTCREFVEQVTSYTEGVLSEPQRTRFEAHARYCPGCGPYLQQMLRTIQAIRDTPYEDILRAGERIYEGMATPSATDPESEQASIDELLREFRRPSRPSAPDRG